MSTLAGYGPGGFTVATFRPWLDSRSPEERWELIGAVCSVADLYRHTHLDPAHRILRR